MGFTKSVQISICVPVVNRTASMRHSRNSNSNSCRTQKQYIGNQVLEFKQIALSAARKYQQQGRSKNWLISRGAFWIPTRRLVIIWFIFQLLPNYCTCDCEDLRKSLKEVILTKVSCCGLFWLDAYRLLESTRSSQMKEITIPYLDKSRYDLFLCNLLLSLLLHIFKLKIEKKGNKLMYFPFRRRGGGLNFY